MHWYRVFSALAAMITFGTLLVATSVAGAAKAPSVEMGFFNFAGAQLCERGWRINADDGKGNG